MNDMICRRSADCAPQPGCGPVLGAQSAQNTPLRQQVFEYVRGQGHVARADVARALGISAGSVTAITADLISQNLMQEVVDAVREPGRGRPPVALEVVPGSTFVIGLKVSDERHSAVLADFAGNMICDATLPTARGRKSPQALLDEIATLLNTLMAKTDLTLPQVAAIGIGISGLVDFETGTVAWSPLLDTGSVDLAHALRERFHRPVYVDNDTNMLTLAELWFGEGRALSNFVVITVEHGVGMGLVLNNRLFRGLRGMGLELGHTKVQMDGALCRCGQRGCLEAYLADYALARETATALGLTGPMRMADSAALDLLLTEAKAGNQAARTIFRRAGRYLSVGLANVIQLFDPEQIILSGERMQYDYLYADSVLEEMHRMTHHTPRPQCAITFHAWGDLVWARGATALALSAVTTDLLGA